MLTIERLKEALWFNAEEGRFYWNTKVRGICIGAQAGSFDAHGYGQVKVDGVLYKEHRLVWFYVTGLWPADQIDHANHDRRDNRFENLSEVSNMGNHLNRPMQATNTSGFVGVSYCARTKCFEAYITVNKKRKNLGHHKTFEAAVAARTAANVEHGFHANHGIGRGVPRKPAMSSKRGRPSHQQSTNF